MSNCVVALAMQYRRSGKVRFGSKTGKAQNEHMFSASPSLPDSTGADRLVRVGPMLSKRLEIGGEQ
jgi:hypothetical protein